MPPTVPHRPGHRLLASESALAEKTSRSDELPVSRSRRPAGWGCGEWTMEGPRPDLKTGGRQEGAAPPARRAATVSEADSAIEQAIVEDCPLLQCNSTASMSVAGTWMGLRNSGFSKSETKQQLVDKA